VLIEGYNNGETQRATTASSNAGVVAKINVLDGAEQIVVCLLVKAGDPDVSDITLLMRLNWIDADDVAHKLDVEWASMPFRTTVSVSGVLTARAFSLQPARASIRRFARRRGE
jgi:hypothetical protein